MILEDLKRMFREMTARDWLEIIGSAAALYAFMFLAFWAIW